MINMRFNKIMKLIMALMIVFFACIVCGNITKTVTNDKNIYINEVDGYKFVVPDGYSIDESFLPYAVRFLSDDCIIEIYTEESETKDEILSYINYSNTSIASNEADYNNVTQIERGGKTILSWKRDKLSKITKDKNHYLKIDIPKNKRVYTIIVKSAREINDYEKYITALKITKPSKSEHKTPEIKYATAREFNSETRQFYNQYLLNAEKIEWGIYQYDYMETEELSKIENKLDHKFGLLLLYSEFEDEYDPTKVRAFLDKAYSEERIVELTLQPKRYHQQGNELFRVLDGYYDEFLHDYAESVANFKHPVLFRFTNEMNGDWCEYSGYQMSLDTQLYREMYKYIYNIFKKNNADNVIWVWNPNGKSFPDFKWNAEEMYYPGNDYVDVLGLTLYNTGTFYEGEKWTEFDDLYKPLYEKEIKKYDMPFIITEFSCARAGGDKEEWTRKMLENIEEFPNIKLAAWWNGADFTADGKIARAYYINDSKEMCEIFKNYFKNR